MKNNRKTIMIITGVSILLLVFAILVFVLKLPVNSSKQSNVYPTVSTNPVILTTPTITPSVSVTPTNSSIDDDLNKLDQLLKEQTNQQNEITNGLSDTPANLTY